MAPARGTRGARGLDAIKGWFNEIDRRCFVALLDSQRDSPPGVLVELGAFQGKSAVVIGDYVREGERFIVVDLFGDQEHFSESMEDLANQRENSRSYPGLTRLQFEQNYLSLHERLPVVVQGFSSEVVDHVEPGTARFIHVDASHLYAAVKTDCESAKRLLRPGGVVAFDDYRNHRSPGVGAAVWEAVVTDGLIPVATTRKKMYACFDDPTPHQATLRAMVADDPDFFEMEEVEIRGRMMVRMSLSSQRGRHGDDEDDGDDA
ncbi:MAG TPA: class I SAM-dependent methyltransferase [Nocardioides sp.]|nr:class I SAM-dependent methyltransferase [Nocardioides sp.]